MLRRLLPQAWLRQRISALEGVPNERGQVLILAALMVTVLLGLVGLAIDSGVYYAERRQAQNAADEAALAAVHELTAGSSVAQASAAAVEYAASNGFGGVPNPVTVIIPPTSGDHIGDPNFVEVIVESEPTTFFIHTIVNNAGYVSARGVAGITSGPGTYGLLLLAQNQCRALDVSGSGSIIVNNGGIMVDSDCAGNAFRKTGSASVIADVIDVVGGYNGPTSSCPPPDPANPPNDTVCANPRTSQPFVADPLAGLPPPNLNDLGISPDSGGTSGNPQKKHISNGDYTFHPGVYYGGIKLSTNGNVTFLPGTYVMAGGGIDISSNGTVNGNGVTFYNTYDPLDPNSAQGRCNESHISGSTSTGSALTAPTSGPYKDIIYWQDQNCVDNSGNGIRFHHSGSGTLVTAGIIYLPTGWMHVTGSGYIGAVQIIADHFDKSGNSYVVIDVQEFVSLSPSAVTLVE